jgi:hypothetical protein
MEPMYSIDELIIAVFCCVDDLLKEVLQGGKVRAHGFAPKLSDSEVLTMEIVGEYLKIDTDEQIWQYFRRHWHSWFPTLATRSTFVRQAAGLWQYKERMQQRLAEVLGAFDERVHLIDGLPMPVCRFGRACCCCSFQGEADYGYCASKQETYYGFRGHLCVSARGIITGFTLTAANVDERDAAPDILQQIQGMLIGDKGYIRPELKAQLQGVSIELQTALRKNMQDTRPRAWVKLLMRVRRLIETVIGQLAGRFHLERIHARDMWHLTSRINRKLLAHTVCFWLRRDCLNPLAFDLLVKD